MAEKAPDDNNLEDSIADEFSEDVESNGDELTKSGSEKDLLHKRQRLQTPSPNPTPFMLQRKILFMS